MRLSTTALFISLTFGAAAIQGDDAKDPANWMPVMIQGDQKMPEFDDIAEWINSPPLKALDLKGKVVVVHFITYG